MPGGNGIVKREFLHRVVFTVPCPKQRASGNGACGNECVAKLNTMTFSIAPQVFSGPPADFSIGWNADQSAEQLGQTFVFRRTGSRPEFSHANRREENECIGCTQLYPFRDNGGVPSAGDFDEDIGVNKNRHCPRSLSNLDPRRRLRTSSVLSGAAFVVFRIPTNRCIASMRCSRLPRYRSLTACRTSSETVVFSLRARAWSALQSWSSR